MIAKTDPGARKEHAAYCSHLRDPEMEGCDCDEPEIRPFAERCGLPGTAPAPPPERCAKCGQAWGEHVGDGHDEPICPDPHKPWCEMSMPRNPAWQHFGCTCNAPRGVKDLLAHDAALRAEVERLRERARNHVQDMNILQMKCDYALAARNQENALFLAEKARVAALTAALREIADFAHCDAEGFIVQPCPCPLCALSLRIAREALARIEEGK